MPAAEFTNALRIAFDAGRQAQLNLPANYSFDTFLEDQVDGIVGGQFNLSQHDINKVLTTRQREFVNVIAELVNITFNYWPVASGKTLARRRLAHRILMDDN